MGGVRQNFLEYPHFVGRWGWPPPCMRKKTEARKKSKRGQKKQNPFLKTAKNNPVYSTKFRFSKKVDYCKSNNRAPGALFFKQRGCIRGGGLYLFFSFPNMLLYWVLY